MCTHVLRKRTTMVMTIPMQMRTATIATAITRLELSDFSVSNAETSDRPMSWLFASR